MAIDVTFYTFSKKTNSTKRPGGGTTYKCNIISPSSVISPEISLALAANPTAYNYAYIPEFSRYYYVNDWTYGQGLWMASLNVDYLASWKSFIGEQKQYVVRSSAVNDGNIIDTLYPTKNEVTRAFSVGTNSEGGNLFASSIQDGSFIVGIVNSDSSAIGCVSYYQFSNAQFRALCNKLMGTTDWMYNGIDEIGEELTKVLFNPFQYIASCMWFPIPGGGGSSSISYGWWDLGVTASRIGGSPYAFSASFTVPKHPQADRGVYLNGSPFSRYSLDWPCFGRISLDANVLKDYDTILADVYVDPISGIGTLRIAPGGIPIYSQQSQIGVPIQLAQMAVDYKGVASNLASGIASAARFDIAGMFGSIGNAIESAIPQLSTAGNNGSVSAYRFQPILCAEFYNVVDEDNEHLGRPLCLDSVPQSIPGYMVCGDVELEIPCTQPEMDNIIRVMESGFYYE